MVKMRTFLKLLFAVVALALAPSLYSQPDMRGKTVKGFIFPEYGKDGSLEWRLKGDAWFKTNELIQVTQVQLETFEGGKQVLVFTTPACLFDRTQKSAATDEPVKIAGAYYLIEGTGFVWWSDEGRIVISRNVRVTFTNARSHLHLPGGTGDAPTEEKK